MKQTRGAMRGVQAPLRHKPLCRSGTIMCLRLPWAQTDRGGGCGARGRMVCFTPGLHAVLRGYGTMQWCGHAFRCGATRWCGVRRVKGLTLHLPLRRLVMVPLRMHHVRHISDCAHRTLFPVCAVYTNSPRTEPIAQPVPALLSPSAAPSLCTSYLLAVGCSLPAPPPTPRLKQRPTPKNNRRH